MFTIGCHLSSSKGFLAMGQTAVRIGANTFQFFTRNPRGGNAKPLDLTDVAAFNTFAKEQGIEIILAHAPYTLNACAADEGLRAFAFNTMRDDLERLSYLDMTTMYNFHPGSHVKQGVDIGIDYIADLLNRLLISTPKTMVLLETMAGKGSEIGRSFEELAAIIEKTERKELLGICLDTCHVYDAGYDIVNHLPDVLNDFDRILGLERLKAIHINDSKNPFASHKDRHEKIGEGSIGIDALTRIIRHPALCKLPFYLETPNEVEGHAKEIALLKELALKV